MGVFLVNSDSAVLLAKFRSIASDFDRLSSASWIINSYIIGVIAAQPLYGKLSDIYGRKPLLLTAYLCYCVGGILSGTGFSFWGILLGRVICGFGNAGITVLISTLIVELVPMREVAVWRGYVYAVNQIGRAIGPSLGGLIADRLNWRWSLLYQVPLNATALVFIWWKMSFPAGHEPKIIDGRVNDNESCQQSKFKRIDFSGSLSLGLANISLLMFVDQIQKNPNNVVGNIRTMFPMSTWLGFMLVFIAVEAFWAREPILPLRLLRKRNVVTSYSIQLLQTAAQLAIYTSIPLYFIITNGDSSTTVAAKLLFITLGAIIGGLISGFVIQRTGRYRSVTIISLFLSNISCLAIFLRWRGETGWAETLFGFPIGVAFGVSLSAAFIALTAGLDLSDVAVSTSGFYLSLNLGSLLGVSSASLLISSSVERRLRERLQDFPNAERIIHDVTSNFDSINELPAKVAELVLNSYTQSFINVWLFSLTAGCLALGASLFMLEGRLCEPELQTETRSKQGCDYNTFGARDEAIE